MEWLWQIDLLITYQVQSIGPSLAGLMRGISFLGSQEFFLLFLPIILWCWNYPVGIRMGVILLLTGGINSLAKFIFQAPRPYWINSGVTAYSGESSFGFPSGHTQTSTGVWGVFGLSIQKKWLKYPSFLVIFLVSLSRVYLGVHFTQDVLGGLLLGIMIIWIFLILEKKVLTWLRTRNSYQLYSLSAISSVLYLFIMLLPTIYTQTRNFPSEWVQQSRLSFPSVVIDPWNIKDILTVAGTWFGFSMGLVWHCSKYVGFKVEGTRKEKLARYLIGCSGIFIIWYGLGELFPVTPEYIGWIFRIFRYALIGFWITAFAPLVFYKLKLARE